jgi:hypothetical protein
MVDNIVVKKFTLKFSKATAIPEYSKEAKN